ncbi:MAG: hypothetical protein HYY68_03900 [Thaumarchaeota archaeon]|nr:hypothetical protein [Nitrososphaerota archaeon]
MVATVAAAVDPEWKGLYRAGGISGLVYGILLIIGTLLFIALGPLPTGGEAFLKYFAGRTALGWTTFSVFVLANFFLAAVVLSLYFALKGVNRIAVLFGTGFQGLFVVLDLGVTLPSFWSLITLSGNYAAATSDAQRAVYVAGAEYASGVLSLSLPVYTTIVPFFGSLIIALVMMKGIFSKGVAYLGVVAGIVGIVAGIPIPALSILLVIATFLGAIWFLFIGYRLYKLSRP